MLEPVFGEVDTWSIEQSRECLKDIGCPDDGDKYGCFEDAIEGDGGKDQGIKQLGDQGGKVVAQPEPSCTRFAVFQKMVTGHIIELADHICAQRACQDARQKTENHLQTFLDEVIGIWLECKGQSHDQNGQQHGQKTAKNCQMCILPAVILGQDIGCQKQAGIGNVAQSGGKSEELDDFQYLYIGQYGGNRDPDEDAGFAEIPVQQQQGSEVQKEH